jgi:putative ABC transport system permease protein
VRAQSDPEPLAPLLREEVRALDPDLALYRVMTLDRAVAELQWNGRTSNVLIIALSCIAVSLAGAGLYAVTSHTLVRQMREMGVRMALGGRPALLGWLVVRFAMARLGVGLVLGLAVTVVWERLFTPVAATGPRLFDPLNLTALTVLLIIVSIAACVWPVRRVMSLDPASILRHE